MNNELLRYSLQLSMLSMLLSKNLLSDIEYLHRIIFIMFCKCGIIELHRKIQKRRRCSEKGC